MNKKKKERKARPKASVRPKKPAKSVRSRQPAKHAEKSVAKPSTILSVQIPTRPGLPPISLQERRVFSIEIDSISGETTIGDLIVAFPRTRDVLMKHGLRFDVEEAGYLYMTLNVFSAIHGLPSHTLIQELHTASKELPPPPVSQPLRSVVTPPIA